MATIDLDNHQRHSIHLCAPPYNSAMSKEEIGEAYEEEHVHTVYEQIASHFSSTRYKVCIPIVLKKQRHFGFVLES